MRTQCKTDSIVFLLTENEFHLASSNNRVVSSSSSSQQQRQNGEKKAVKDVCSIELNSICSKEFL